LVEALTSTSDGFDYVIQMRSHPVWLWPVTVSR
jgi:hypothetical protein